MKPREKYFEIFENSFLKLKKTIIAIQKNYSYLLTSPLF